MRNQRFYIDIFILLAAIIALCFAAVGIENPTIATIIATLLGSLITFLISQISSTIHSSKSQFSGYYRAEILDTNNPTKIIKRNKLRLVEKEGNILTGEFSRYFPAKDKLAHWKCSGQIVLDQFLLTYRALDDTTPSRGVILVKLDTTRRRNVLPCYTGKYYKFEGERIVSHNINLIKISKDEYDKY